MQGRILRFWFLPSENFRLVPMIPANQAAGRLFNIFENDLLATGQSGNNEVCSPKVDSVSSGTGQQEQAISKRVNIQLMKTKVRKTLF